MKRFYEVTAIVGTLLMSTGLVACGTTAENVTRTDMGQTEATTVVKIQLADLRKWEIESQKIEGEYDMDYVASLTQDQKFQVYKTDPNSVAKCIDNINRILNPTEEEIQAQIEKKKEATAREILNKITGRKKGNEEDSEG